MDLSRGKAVVAVWQPVMQTNLDADKLRQAINICIQQNCSLYEYHSKTSPCSTEIFARIWSARLQLPFIDFSTLPADCFWHQHKDVIYFQQQQWIAIKFENQKIICFSNPLQWSVLHDYLKKHDDHHAALVDMLPLQLHLATKASEQHSASWTHQPHCKEESLSLIKPYVDQLLEQAIAKQASDIHVEPAEHHIQIRMRIDGILHIVSSAPRTLLNMIISRIKILANLDIAERRRPQDGRFTFTSLSLAKRDCRINSCPTLFGEKIVIRLLNPQQKIPSLTALGMRKKDSDKFIHTLNKPQGLILVTGPTGSGKTLTLYAALAQLNSTEKNISSIEDPVEITMPGINQVHVNSKIGLDFSCALRAFLRQDPDVIMVGEIRDTQTANMAIRAAQTGHLVLATLHTNNASETILRLQNMEIDTFNIANALSCIIAQRLVRKICRYCQQKGCQHCHQGFQGRTGIFEVIHINESIREAIFQNQSPAQLMQLAKQNGTQTLLQAAKEKIKEGITNFQEIIRVTLDE